MLVEHGLRNHHSLEFFQETSGETCSERGVLSYL